MELKTGKTDYNPNGVLLIHGFTSTPQALMDMAEKIHDAGFKVYLPKLPGHGTKWQDLEKVKYTDWIDFIVHKSEKILKEVEKLNIVGLF